MNGEITIFHTKLMFHSIEDGWQYVGEHPEETPEWGDGKWVARVALHKELGSDFFRPRRLEFDARPYEFNPLIDARKVGSNWILRLKGADEPNEAEAVLDSDFKLVKVTRH